MKSFLFTTKMVRIDAKNEHEARKIFQQKVSTQYNKLIRCVDWKCRECGAVAGYHKLECSECMPVCL